MSSIEREDRFTARFVELTPPTRIVEAIIFDSEDPAFAGEMTMVVTNSTINKSFHPFSIIARSR